LADKQLYILAQRYSIGEKMANSSSAAANPIRQFLVDNTRQHKIRASESAINDRQQAEILVVREGTLLYMTGDTGPVRLEDVKDYLRSLKGNPFGVTPDGSSADAKVQKDMIRICRKALLFQGEQVNIVGKELNRNAVIFLDIDVAAKIVGAEKDAKKRAALQERMQNVLHLKTREGYERR